MHNSKHTSNFYQKSKDVREEQTAEYSKENNSKTVVVYDHNSLENQQRMTEGSPFRKYSREKKCQQIQSVHSNLQISRININENPTQLQENAKTQLIKSSQEVEQNEIVPRVKINSKNHCCYDFNDDKKSSRYIRLKQIANQKMEKKSHIGANKNQKQSYILPNQTIFWKRKKPTAVILKTSNYDPIVSFQQSSQTKKKIHPKLVDKKSASVAKSHKQVPFERQILKMKSMYYNINKTNKIRDNSFRQNQHYLSQKHKSRTLSHSIFTDYQSSQILKDINEVQPLKNQLNFIMPRISLQATEINQIHDNIDKSHSPQIVNTYTRSKSQTNSYNRINYTQTFHKEATHGKIKRKDDIIEKKRNSKTKFENGSFKEAIKLRYQKKIQQIIEKLNCLNNSNIHMYDVLSSTSLIHHTIQPNWSYSVQNKQVKIEKRKSLHNENQFMEGNNTINCDSLINIRQDSLNKQATSSIDDFQSHMRSKTIGYQKEYSQIFG